MSTTPATPKGKTMFNPTTPATARVTGSNTVQASPHYATTRRHSLYGSEDRVVIDPGSRIWKVGFSGEGRPRDVFYTDVPNGPPFWKLTRPMNPTESAEEDRMLEARLKKCLRSVFHDSLLADPKARKVILVEHPLLPLYIKDMIAQILFENQVPSVSFACSHLLSLFAAGRITGLVIDCGHLESVALPIFAARPMFPQIQTTPIAGARLTSHIRALLLMFATYLPPPASLSAAVSILTDSVIEEIKARCCFVGNVLGSFSEPRKGETSVEEDSEMDIPPSESGSESSSISNTTSTPRSGTPTQNTPPPSTPTNEKPLGEVHLQALASLYKRHSTATDIQMRVMPPPSQQTGTGRGTLIIPGWIRERAAEVLFEGGDVDESSLAETILDALLRVPRDLRKTLVSSILVSGGTAMLPGFIPRLHAEIVLALNPPSASSRYLTSPGRPALPPYDKYGSLRPLLPHISILNNPSPPLPASERAGANAGKAPAFSPATLAWVGGSLAGSLKTGGVEVARDKWDDDPSRNADDSMDLSTDVKTPPRSILPDWTRSPLPVGAPSANAHSQASA
ncbi:fungal-specific actin related protein [Gymnopilus junonius]|uniref:Fungal-specific actin related protein n=1 Tax=Gymnopilus junonius TaxID=109634 RepID=A0A9P5NTM8_GYMJU|nr:fungal-specific actin related protein [Gymnopilus junonius]